jgi:DNA helicase HerA-like ATPase
MAEPILVAKSNESLYLLPQYANRHGLIAGATGTGKTVTLQRLAEGFSRIGVPVFMADVKGDLAGLSQPGRNEGKVKERLAQLGLAEGFPFEAVPIVFWDAFGAQGHPVRTTVTELGPLLLARMLNLNETQAGVLTATFKIADDAGLPLVDLKDLRAMLKHAADNAKDYTTRYGNISSASVGAIQRGLLTLEQQGGEQFFGEPALDIQDLIQNDGDRGVINILAAEKLLSAPKLYGVLLLWLLAELFEQLPEVGDPAKPKLVFFFDEAHLLFNDAPAALVEKIEQVVRLIRSKGVGVYFVTQNPLDIPDTVLGQLGNRVQHALRAFTPRDQKAVATAATTLRPNPKLDVERAITELAVGEALVSFLDETGRPGIVERALIVPPGSRLGPVTEAERRQTIAQSAVGTSYDKAEDKETAYEMLLAKYPDTAGGTAGDAAQPEEQGFGDTLREMILGSTGPRGGRREGLLESMTKSAVRAAASRTGREIAGHLLRGVLGSMSGSTKSSTRPRRR